MKNFISQKLNAVYISMKGDMESVRLLHSCHLEYNSDRAMVFSPTISFYHCRKVLKRY